MGTNFPTSLDSYSTKVDNVDNVMAAHINNVQDAVEALEAKIGIDGSVVTNSLDYFLKHSSGAYRTHTHDGSSDDGANIPINNISKINTSSLSDNQILRYNAATGNFENETLTTDLNSLSNVSTSGASQYDALIYNGSTWEKGTPYAVYAA